MVIVNKRPLTSHTTLSLSLSLSLSPRLPLCAQVVRVFKELGRYCTGESAIRVLGLAADASVRALFAYSPACLPACPSTCVFLLPLLCS